MTNYMMRPATLADLSTLVHHRHAMMFELGDQGDYAATDQAFAAWLQQTMTNGLYYGWLLETESGEVAAGGGVSLLPWPPNLEDLNHYRPFIYNIYTEPAHRRRGLARQIMETIHQWCRERGFKTVALHASHLGQPLYESLGYQPANEMILKL